MLTDPLRRAAIDERMIAAMRLMLVLLARINAWSTCISRAQIQNECRTESVRPTATVVSTF